MARRNKDLVKLGQRIAELRHDRELKQDAVAHEAGIATKTLSEIERGLGNATFLTLLGIARAMKVNVQSFLTPFAPEETARSAEDVAMAFRILDLMKTARDEGSR
jgi:transcriptional regulator with XRE-family HTH domain